MATDTPFGPATDVPHRRSDDILSMLAERLGAHFSASSIFGAAVERDGVTVIPVASMRFGFGAGGGADASGEQTGEGGGGGGSASPVGYIELKGGGARFVPIVRPASVSAVVAMVVLAGMLILRSGRVGRR